MKKVTFILLCALLLLSLCACGGKIDGAVTHSVDSARYSQADIADAIDVIKKEFRLSWRGCTLTEISYAGDDRSDAHQAWADRNGADEVMVLTSTFDVDHTGGDGSLNPNSTYRNWMWILVRKTGGDWEHVDHGY